MQTFPSQVFHMEHVLKKLYCAKDALHLECFASVVFPQSLSELLCKLPVQVQLISLYQLQEN